MPPPGVVAQHGTAVRLRVANPLCQLLDPGFLEAVLLRPFEPLFDEEFDEVLSVAYPGGVRFVVNGRALYSVPGAWREAVQNGSRSGRG